jgi:predicted RNase H-like nuclease (RuvC/YqgF family)
MARSISSNRTTHWTVSDNIAKTLEVIKKNTLVDLTESFKEKIEKVVEQVSAEEGRMIQESLQEKELNDRRAKIEELTKRYKDDPVRLQMLSQIASELNEL